MARNLTFAEVHGCMVVAQASEAPGEEETIAYLRALKQYVNGTVKPRGLIVTEGGAPGPALRQQIDRIVSPHKARTRFAIVTGATFARGVLRAIRALNPSYQGFAPENLGGALSYLEVPAFQMADLLRRLNELRAELGLPPVKV